MNSEQGTASPADMRTLHDRSIALLALHVLLITLPVLGLFWALIYGPWLQLAWTAIALLLSIVVFRQSNRYLPHMQRNLFDLQHILIYAAALMFVLSLTAAIAQQKYWQDYCSTSPHDDDILYKPMPLPGVLEPQITPSPILPPIVSTTPNSEASSPPRPSEPYYPYYDPCFGYSTAALILGGIITPILSVIHVVLLGLTCSRLWRFATRSMSNNNLLLVEQSSSFAATNTGQKGTILVPMSFDSYVNYQQWQQQNNSTVSKVGKESPPKYE